MPLKEVDWDNYQFRCHYFGELMTKTKGKTNQEKYNEAKSQLDSFTDKLFSADASGKSPTQASLLRLNELESKVNQLKLYKDIPTLSDTCKRRLAQIYTEETTGRTKDIESEYLEKGLKTEEDSITLYSLRTNTMYKKNKERVANGFVIGEIDFDDEEQDLVVDTKSSWDVFSFDATVASPIKHIYWWQGQMYMWLKNRSRFRLAYCLNDTPSEIFQRLVKRMRYNFIGEESDYQDALTKLAEKHTYSDLPLERKIRIYEIKRDDEKIEMAKSYIPHFRNYLKNITNTKLEEDEIED